MRKLISAASLALGLTLAGTHVSLAQSGEYPAQAVKVVVANTAGSASDNLFRIVAARLSVLLGQQFLVLNQAGAGGTIGAEAVARAAPDGYTLFATSVQTQSIAPHLYPNAKYKPVDDFAPITMLAKTENVLVAAAEQPFKTLPEFIAYAKANPGKLDMANAGPGAQSHLAGAMLTLTTKVDVVHVPYKGAASVTAVMGNQSHLTFAPLPAVLPGIQSGKLRPLAVGSAARSALLPNVPTVAEAGFPEFNLVGWSGLVAPKGTPAPILEKLRTSVVKVVEEPATREALSKAGGEPWLTTSAEMARIMAEDLKRYGEAVKLTGAKIE